MTTSLLHVVVVGIVVALSIASAAAEAAAAGGRTRGARLTEISAPPHMELPRQINASIAAEAEVQYEAKSMELARIVGGVEAVSGQYPFFVRMESLIGMSKCGGSLVAADVVLTAAHCNADNGQYAISVNGYKATFLQNTEEKRTLSVEKRPHPDFVVDTFANDYMLLKLRDPVPDFEPVTLNRNNAVPGLEEDIRVIGLGTLSEGGSFPNFLQEVIVQHTDMEYCQRAYADVGLDLVRSEIMFCAQGDNKDACQGDSGMSTPPSAYRWLLTCISSVKLSQSCQT